MSEAIDGLGLGGSLPGPGWQVLDAARTHRFTGELVMHGRTVVRVYLDRGLIYTAERAGDRSLGARLVDAGALSEAQLEYGTLRVGDIEHLGRLFDRVPSINRDGVLVVNQLMTDECVRSIAGDHVDAVDVTPYRHHSSGMHRWDVIREVEATLALGVPELALPSPAPEATPVAAPAPEAFAGQPRATPTVDPTEPSGATEAGDVLVAEDAGPAAARTDESFDDPLGDHEPDDEAGDDPGIDALLDDLVRWDEPSRVDPSVTPRPRRGERATTVVDTISDDWIDRLDDRGIADAPVGAGVGRLARVAVRAQEHFEMVWPSGETIDVVPHESDGGAAVETESDIDRAGPTARIGGSPATIDAPAPAEPESSELAIRRAVATIDTGSLEARRRLVDAASPTAVETPDLPGRLAMRSEHIARSTTAPTTPRSVFDEVPFEVPDVEPEPAATTPDDRHGRAGALRRLISHLRGD